MNGQDHSDTNKNRNKSSNKNSRDTISVGGTAVRGNHQQQQRQFVQRGRSRRSSSVLFRRVWRWPMVAALLIAAANRSTYSRSSRLSSLVRCCVSAWSSPSTVVSRQRQRQRTHVVARDAFSVARTEGGRWFLGVATARHSTNFMRLFWTPTTTTELALSTSTTGTREKMNGTPDDSTAVSSLSSTTGSSAVTVPSPTTAPAKFNAVPFSYHQELILTIERLTNRGWGVGRIALKSNATLESENNNDTDDTNDESASAESSSRERKHGCKWVVLIPNVIPGEVVKVRVFRNFASYSEADVVELIDPSPDRVTPQCPLAQDCGGCQLQHMSIAAQRAWKTEHVRDLLDRSDVTPTPEVTPTLGTDLVFGYRSKLTPHYQAPEKRRRRQVAPPKPKFLQEIGFQKQTSRQLLDVPMCPIATDAVNAKYQSVRTELLAAPTTRRKGATLLLRQGDGNYVSTDHREYLNTTVQGLTFSYRAGNFFQNNYDILPLMVDHVLKHARKPTTTKEQQPMTHLVDCYCGSGLFAVSAAPYFETVVGIEINQEAVEEARANADRNGLGHCQFRAASAEAIFADLINTIPVDQTCVVVDPPRKGCSEEFLEQLYEFAPARVVYMSCDPSTQVRDAEELCRNGYEITSVQPFDLFPQTRHIECLAIFERADA